MTCSACFRLHIKIRYSNPNAKRAKGFIRIDSMEETGLYKKYTRAVRDAEVDEKHIANIKVPKVIRDTLQLHIHRQG
jgi:hypothetical protein